MDVNYSYNLSLPILGYEFDFIKEHFRTRQYLFEPEPGKGKVQKEYHDAAHFWKDVFAETVCCPSTVRLVNFKLSEWVPRRPGLFHTEGAERARQEALHQIQVELQSHSGNHSRSRVQEVADVKIVYNPRGKINMLKGGIGNIRVKPIQFPDGKYWLMGACSSVSAHEGIPVMVPDSLYLEIVDAVKSAAYWVGDIAGCLEFIPEAFAPIFLTYEDDVTEGIPQLYLKVDHLESSSKLSDPQEGYFVTVATSFLSKFESQFDRLFATYVTFDLTVKGERKKAVSWMKEEYVEGFYGGRIVTDFDQQAPQFGGCLMSLNDVMSDGEIPSYDMLLGHFSNSAEDDSPYSLKFTREFLLKNRNRFNFINFGSIVSNSSDVVVAKDSSVATGGATIRLGV